MRRCCFLIGVLLIALQGYAQQDTSKAAAATDTAKTAKPQKFKLRKTVKMGNRKLKLGDVYGATELYEKVLENKPEQTKVAWQMAESYYMARDYEKAQTWYKYVLDKDAEHYPTARYWYALMLKMNGDYYEAKNQFNAFIKEYKGDEATYKKWAKVDAEGCDLALDKGAKPEKINLTHLDKRVNSAYTDIAPIMWNDSTLLYASLRSDSIVVVADAKNDTAPDMHHIKFYVAQKTDTGYKQSTRFDKFDEVGKHVANGAFSPDHKRFYFTVCGDVNFGKAHCEIYVSELQEGQWQPARALGDDINSPLYTSTEPAVGTYKDNIDVLYFVSDRPGGKGGTDIWYSFINAKGKYSAPKDAGKINTDRDDATPYYDNSTGTLYYSSQGYPGFGGYDVFKTLGKANKWTNPENMGAPINSSTDDMYFRYLKGQKGGFVVSNRPGIISLKSKTCCDDIFAFDHYTTIDIAVKGLVYDEALPEYPLNGVKVSLALRNYGGLDEDIMVNEATTADNQHFLFDVNANSAYKLIASKETYLTGSVEFNTNGITKSDTLEYKIYLKRIVKNKAYSLKNIYYDYNKADIRDESKPTLDSLYQILVENPNITIELGSHTDSRGSDTYNQTLSQKRAESCVAYLIAKGIDQTRIVAKGYGESQPLEDCSKYPDCPAEGEGDCPCHQKNRRTEFKIIGETAPVKYDDDTFDNTKK